MPPVASAGSSRRKLGQPTVCLECYLRKVKCDRKRPCNTCIRRGTEHLCKTFNTSELDPETLQKKQARRSLAEINAFLEATRDDPADDSDPQQNRKSLTTAPEHPITAFINHLLKDLSVSDDPLSDHNSAESSSAGARSNNASPQPSSPCYAEKECFEKISAFTAILPEWSRLASLIRHYLWHVDWKFTITSQDLLEEQMKDLFLRVVVPCQNLGHAFPDGLGPNSSLSGISFQQGDLSKLALLASVLGETVETLNPDTLAEVMPVTRRGVTFDGAVNIPADASPRVRALMLLSHHIPSLVEECVRLDEMTIDLVQANVSAFSFWTSQGLHGTGPTEFPLWDVTMRAARGCNLFEDPGTSSQMSQKELDHRRRLAWLVYGYDHAFAVGANTKPLIVESQFSVDQPSDAPPWTSCGAPPDSCLSMLQVQGAKMAQLVSNTLCYGPPMHRKAMETDSIIVSIISGLHPSYAAENPDTSFDTRDPFRSRRRCWLTLTTAWQRGSLHRPFFFPNGRINNGELATSRHIATDSALRSITGVRELRSIQNRYSDYQGSAWWYQYLTEPSMTLATAALLLMRSKGKGVPGLADENNCWPTVVHFIKLIDDSLQDIDASIRDPSVCLPSFVSFGQRCCQLIRQLRNAVQVSMDALIKAQPGMEGFGNLQVDESLFPLLHPRARRRLSASRPSQSEAVDDNNAGSGRGSRPSISDSISVATQKRGSGKKTLGRSSPTRSAATSMSNLHASVQSRNPSISSQISSSSSSNTASPQNPFALPSVPAQVSAASLPDATWSNVAFQPKEVKVGNASSMATDMRPSSTISPRSTLLPNPVHQSDNLSFSQELPSGNLSLSLGPEVHLPLQMQSRQHLQQAHQQSHQHFPHPIAPQLYSHAHAHSHSGHQTQARHSVPAPHYGVPAMMPAGHLLSPAEPIALKSYYSDDSIQRAAEGRGLSDWINSVQMGVMLPQPAPPRQPPNA